MAIRRSPREKLFDGFNITLMLFLMFVTLYPFWHVIMASFSDSNLLLQHTGVLILPEGFST